MSDEAALNTKIMLDPVHGQVIFHERGPDAGKAFYLDGANAGHLAFEYDNFKPIPLPVKPSPKPVPQCNYATELIIPRLPCNNEHSWETDPIDEFLVKMAGCTIVSIGSFIGVPSIEGGGLAIDYKMPGSDNVHRVVFEFCELGMRKVFES